MKRELVVTKGLRGRYLAPAVSEVDVASHVIYPDVDGAEVSPPRRAVKIRISPKVGQIFWCRLPFDAELPEFWKTRPVVIVSKNNILEDAAVVLPITSRHQGGNPWAVPVGRIMNGEESWVVCDKPMTVATSRLSLYGPKIARMSEEYVADVLHVLFSRFPVPRALREKE